LKKRNLNPRWDYKFSYDNLTLDDLQHHVLELTVWDHDIGTSNDFLGGVRIGLGTSDASWDDCTGEEVTLWQFLLSKPNTWAESTLPLRSEMGSRKGLRT
jgi:synaptotagmin-like protein